MLSSKLFSWKKKKKNSTIFKNEELIQKLRFEGITDEKILSAIRTVPRELFTEKLNEAYENKALSTDCSQTMTQPFCTAFMISCLNLKNTDKILEIGTGVGWATAIISKLVNLLFLFVILSSVSLLISNFSYFLVSKPKWSTTS